MKLPIKTIQKSYDTEGQALLSILLNPWIVTPTPQQNDYREDGKVQLTKNDKRKINQEVYPFFFLYQLKTHNEDKLFLDLPVDHLLFWLYSNVPFVLFNVCISDKKIYWKTINVDFYNKLNKDNINWKINKYYRIIFFEPDCFSDLRRKRLENEIIKWKQVLIFRGNEYE